MRIRNASVKTLIIGVSWLLISGFQLQSCSHPPDNRINDMGPNSQADLVVLFKRDTSDEAIYVFQTTVTSTPGKTPSSYKSLPGIMTETRVLISGFDALAINFQPDATEDEKAFVKKRISESQIVHKIYENVVPNRISDP